jgi:hypothetical protein
MIKHSRLLTTACLLASFAFAAVSLVKAQEPPPSKAPQQEPQTSHLRITEYVLSGPLDSALTTAELLAQIAASEKRQKGDNSTTQPFAVARNTFRFSHIVGTECMFQTGKQISLVVGQTQSPRGGVLQNTVNQDIGTLIKVKSNPLESGALMIELEYESSTAEPPQGEAINPTITQTMIKNTFSLEKGKPALCISADGPKVITIVLE